MNVTEAFNIIEKLLARKKNDYSIDFVPITFPNEDFAELAAYLEKHYKPDFANRIVFIAFTIMHYYESYVFLDNHDIKPRYPDLINKDLRHIGLEQLADLIRKIIIDNWSCVYLVFKNENHFSLMVIADEYDAFFCNLTGESFNLVEQLVNRQGIYLKKAPNN